MNTLSKIYDEKYDFKKLLLNDSIFVDKSLFIQEFINNVYDVALTTRPRRWYKNFNMSM